MTYKDQWLSAAQVLRAQAIKFEEIAKSAPERPDIDPTEPDKFFFITQLREAVGLPVGALPISPKQAWEEAIAKVKAERIKATRHAFEPGVNSDGDPPNPAWCNVCGSAHIDGGDGA